MRVRASQLPKHNAGLSNFSSSSSSSPSSSSASSSVQLPLTRDEIFLVAREVAEAVRMLHSLRPAVIHRDLSLQNVLVGLQAGKVNRVVLADFGIARAKD